MNKAGARPDSIAVVVKQARGTLIEVEGMINTHEEGQLKKVLLNPGSRLCSKKFRTAEPDPGILDSVMCPTTGANYPVAPSCQRQRVKPTPAPGGL